MTDTQTILAEFAGCGSETAFRELVRRYVDLVYSTAIRLVDGDQQLAEDVAQTVFIDLARTAGRLPKAVMLGGWLHRHTCFVASKTLRTERRRQSRERQAMEINALQGDSEANLAHVAPILDDAINELSESDRTAILLRFFEQRDFRSVGDVLGGNEDAARMRVNRALGKLRSLLTARGVTLPTTAVAALLTAGAVTAAPSGLAATFANTALASAAIGAGLKLTILKTILMTKSQLGLAGALVVVTVATPLWIQHQSLRKARAENEVLRQQMARVGELEAENSRLSNLVSQVNTTTLSKADRSELLRLRGEVGALRKQAATLARRAVERDPVQQQAVTSESAEEEFQRQGIAKMNYTKNWMMALYLFADNNQGQIPTSFNQAQSFLPASGTAKDSAQVNDASSGDNNYNLAPEQFEIVYQGAIKDLTEPQRIIVLREKEAWQGPRGGWLRTYAFADGHSEIHRAEDGNFDAWEAEHMAARVADAGVTRQ